MKYLLCLALVLLPLSASAAAHLADCDWDPYNVIITNGGQQRVATLTQNGGEIEEYGPVISFQIQSKERPNPNPVVHVTSPYEEFCIWNGRIQIQRMNTTGGFNGGSFR
jgi:hypothetical protein